MRVGLNMGGGGVEGGLRVGCTHLLTTLISSLSLPSPACLSFSLASASRPLRMGSSKRLLNSWAVPDNKATGMEQKRVRVRVREAAHRGSQHSQNAPS